MAKAWHTWEHGTVQSFAVVRLWIVHDNCDLTERPLVYYCYIICIPAATFRPTTLFRLSLSRNFCPKMLSALIVCCIYSHALQDTFNQMEQNIDP